MFCCSCDKLDDLPSASPAYASKVAENDRAEANFLPMSPRDTPALDDSITDVLFNGEEQFKFQMTREKVSVVWGVDFAAESGRTLTVTGVVPGHALATCNASVTDYR